MKRERYGKRQSQADCRYCNGTGSLTVRQGATQSPRGGVRKLVRCTHIVGNPFGDRRRDRWSMEDAR